MCTKTNTNSFSHWLNKFKKKRTEQMCNRKKIKSIKSHQKKEKGVFVLATFNCVHACFCVVVFFSVSRHEHRIFKTVKKLELVKS